MSRGYRFGVAGVLVAFAITSHYLGVMFFRPSGPLWDLIQPAIDSGFVTNTYREQHYKVFSQYLPLLCIFFAFAWLLVTEYEAQTTTARRRLR